jgi:hypothetical protein
LTVQLGNDANEYVIADAIRVERVGDAGGATALSIGQTSKLGTVNTPRTHRPGSAPEDRVFDLRQASAWLRTSGSLRRGDVNWVDPVSEIGLLAEACAARIIDHRLAQIWEEPLDWLLEPDDLLTLIH